MIDLHTLSTFLGWCIAINIAILALSSICILAFQDSIKKIHSKLLGLDTELLGPLYFQYLGNYKLAVLIFNIVPYIALRIIA